MWGVVVCCGLMVVCGLCGGVFCGLVLCVLGCLGCWYSLYSLEIDAFIYSSYYMCCMPRIMRFGE